MHSFTPAITFADRKLSLVKNKETTSIKNSDKGNLKELRDLMQRKEVENKVLEKLLKKLKATENKKK